MFELKRYLFVLLLVLMPVFLCAQPKNKTGNIVVHAQFLSETDLRGTNLKGYTISKGKPAYCYALEGAVAILVQSGDTLCYAETGKDGIGIFKKVPYGTYNVEVTHLGYTSFAAEINHDTGNSMIEASLVENGLILDEIKIKGSIPLLLKRGDTLVVNPVAVETQQGAAAIEIIKQVPGIEISYSGTVMVFGEPLQRSYVGGSTLFGAGVLTALNSLDAELVKNIKFYDEDEYTGSVNGKQYRRKVRVMNIETDKQLLSSANGHLLAGLGRDIKGKNDINEKLRYKSGASFNMFDEKTTLNASFYSNNVGLQSGGANFIDRLFSHSGPGENSLLATSIKLERKKGNVYEDGRSIAVSYDYNMRKNKILKFVEKEYYPSVYYIGRWYESASENTNNKKMHEIGLSYSNNNFNRKIKSFSWKHLISFASDRSMDFSSQSEIADSLQIFVQDSSWLKRKDWRVSENILLGGKFGYVSASFDVGESNGSGFRAVEENGTETIYKTSPAGKKLLAGINADIHLAKLGGGEYAWHLTLPVNVSYKKSRDRYFRYDITDEQFVYDAHNSWNYSNNHWSNNIGITAIKTIMKGKSNYAYFNIEAGANQLLINDDDLQDKYRTSKKYYSPYGRINAMIGKVNIHYRFSATAPSLEQLRDYIDDSDILYLRIGNRNLDATYNHSVSVVYSSTNAFSGVSYWKLLFGGEFAQNSIAKYSVYYPNGGVFDEFGGYKIDPGVTVESYKNVDDEKQFILSLSYTGRIHAIKTKFTVGGRGNYMNRFSYLQDILNETQTWTGAFELDFYTSFKYFTLSCRAVSEYVSSSNSIKSDYRYFNQRVDATMNLTLLKHWYINGSYKFIFNTPVKKSIGAINRNNILNVSTGVTLFKGKLKAGFSIFDIFNSSTDFRTMQYADYVQNIWSPTFGRYFSFDAVLQIRKHSFR